MLGAFVALSPEPGFAAARARLPWAAVAGLAALVAGGLTLHFGAVEATGHFPLLDAPVGVMAMGLLVLSAIRPEGALHRALSFRPLVAVGVFSYSLYLLHAPLLQLVWQFGVHPSGIGPAAGFAALMTLGFGVVLLGSYAFHCVLERPFMQPSAQRVARQVPISSP
jgi:peptidoglycan/LPS O-acetylase OafA/YrhL